MKIALIQLRSTDNKSKNIRIAQSFVEEAIVSGAKFIALPEVFNFRGKISQKDIVRTIAEKIPGDSVNPFIEIAKKKNVCILLGSLYEKSSSSSKVYNTSILINERGKISVYRKINLFDAVLSGKKIRESDCFLKGNSLKIVEVFGFKVGLTICYDLRFPELYKKYAQKGVDIICVPSAFTYETGKAHWEILLRSRAIEAQAYVVAPNQVGVDTKGRRCYGHSMIVDSWGKVVKVADKNADQIVYGTIDHENIVKSRRALPGFNRLK